MSRKHRFVFIAVGRTGTTSVEAALRSSLREGAVTRLYESVRASQPAKAIFGDYARSTEFVAGARKHATVRDLAPLGALADPAMRSFAFVRNPWERLVSSYFQSQKPIDLARPRRKLYYDTSHESFEAYLRAWTQEPRPMCGFLTDATGRIAVDYIGRYEAFEAHFREICALIGIPAPPLPRRNASPKPYDYRSYFTPRLLELVEPHVREDCELFGYRLDRPDPLALIRRDS